MKMSIPGLVIGIVLTVLLLVVTPIYYTGIVQWAKSENMMMSDVIELVDKVGDTRILTKDMLADFNLALASKPLNYTYKITRETRVVNPDPVNPGSTYTSYVPVDDISTWEQGDLITVRVEPLGESTFSTIALRLFGFTTSRDAFQITRRVR